MEQWTNSNIRCTVTDGPFHHANMSRCTVDPKKKNPNWPAGIHIAPVGIENFPTGIEIIPASIQIVPTYKNLRCWLNIACK